MRKSKRLKAILSLQNLIALLVLLACLGLGWWLLTHFKIGDFEPTRFVQLIQSMGWVGVLIFIGVSALAVVVSPIPGTPLTMTAGAVWGAVPAAIYAIIGISAGSLLAYFIGRTLGRSTVQALTGKIIYLSTHRGEIYLGWVMFISHLFPVLPFDLMSYGAGISGLSLPIYASATILGTIPGTFFLTYMGSTFKFGVPIGIGLLVAFLLLIVIVSWGVRQHNWMGLRDVVKLE
ncbi:TVP38/TMEM64 family protein [Oscillatoria sp. FACHB-1407]|uniref:TVP38/TMEM64 family protein n=1 Tax=Oscillatoria sp. FACHB-1407 TaxID=2692847 RepID=UPI001687CBFE|nr:TVP38/TMEM64 family protein [Oscillatoria sp. FACHB-1407]MBD2461204.1 TVP38/TMEM64 family protein [Oscillatoria sp. FACHB-1407]